MRLSLTGLATNVSGLVVGVRRSQGEADGESEEEEEREERHDSTGEELGLRRLRKCTFLL